MERRTLTILFVDLQGYTSRTARQTRDENDVLVQELKSFIAKHTSQYGGVLRKSMGDGFLLTFESPTDAIICGQEMQSKIEQRNSNVLNKDNFIRFRIGISTGEVTLDEEGDVFGDAVNIASRIQGFAEPNDVYISEATYLAMNRAEINALDLGPKMFKNALKEVRVYKVLKGAVEAIAPIPLVRKKRFPSLILLIAGSVGAGLLILFLVLRHQKPDIEELMRKKNYGAVVELGEQLIKEDPQNMRLHELMIMALVKTRDFPRLKEQFRDAQEALPDPTAICPPIIEFLVQEGEHRLARTIKMRYCTIDRPFQEQQPPRQQMDPDQQRQPFPEQTEPRQDEQQSLKQRLDTERALRVFTDR